MSALNADQVGESLPETFSTSVIMQQSPSSNPWFAFQWEAIGLLGGTPDGVLDNPQAELIKEQDGVKQFLYRGFTLKLHKDECESYYHNLISPSPCGYVVASVDDEGAPRPTLVSLSYDEAHAYLEGDETLYTVPIPPEIYQWIEAFVLAHYVPMMRSKRKRQDWSRPPGDQA